MNYGVLLEKLKQTFNTFCIYLFILCTPLFKNLWSEFFFFFLEISTFIEQRKHLSKVTVQIFTTLQNISILNKCSFELFTPHRILKKIDHDLIMVSTI